MFLKSLWFIHKSIRTITSVIPTLAQKNFTRIKFLLEDVAHPSEGWGWRTVQLRRLKANKTLIKPLKFVQFPLNNLSKKFFKGRTSIW